LLAESVDWENWRQRRNPLGQADPQECGPQRTSWFFNPIQPCD